MTHFVQWILHIIILFVVPYIFYITFCSVATHGHGSSYNIKAKGYNTFFLYVHQRDGDPINTCYLYCLRTYFLSNKVYFSIWCLHADTSVFIYF
jgi:hypothetical protein